MCVLGAELGSSRRAEAIPPTPFILLMYMSIYFETGPHDVTPAAVEHAT